MTVSTMCKNEIASVQSYGKRMLHDEFSMVVEVSCGTGYMVRSRAHHQITLVEIHVSLDSYIPSCSWDTIGILRSEKHRSTQFMYHDKCYAELNIVISYVKLINWCTITCKEQCVRVEGA